MSTEGARRHRREVRNPVLALPPVSALRTLDPATKSVLAAILRDLAADAGSRAQLSWKQNKGVMAAYWKAVAVYSNHIRRALLSG